MRYLMLVLEATWTASQVLAAESRLSLGVVLAMALPYCSGRPCNPGLGSLFGAIALFWLA